MSAQERMTMRKVFFESFYKYRHRLPLEGVEAPLVDIILWHPEYHAFLSHPDNIEAEAPNDQNVFLHLSLHLALREQITTNRPAGIATIYQTLCQTRGDAHEVEHQMMMCLQRVLQAAQEEGRMPDEKSYLKQLSGLLMKGKK